MHKAFDERKLLPNTTCYYIHLERTLDIQCEVCRVVFSCYGLLCYQLCNAMPLGNKRKTIHKLIPILSKTLICSFFQGLLKEYLRELPEPVFSSCLYQMLVDAVGVFLPNDPDGNAKLVFSILDCLPKANRVRFFLCIVH